MQLFLLDSYLKKRKSQNTDYNIRFQEHNSRKLSCVNTNTDLFNFHLIISELLITGLRPQNKLVKYHQLNYLQKYEIEN